METTQYFEVTYLDTDSGRVRAEAFDDLVDAERFASRQAADEHGWAIIDAVPVRESRKAA